MAVVVAVAVDLDLDRPVLEPELLAEVMAAASNFVDYFQPFLSFSVQTLKSNCSDKNSISYKILKRTDMSVGSDE